LPRWPFLQNRATKVLLTTRPTTAAGVAAALDHWAEFAAESDDFVDIDAPVAFLRDLAEALHVIIASE
jgi:hypothetical protein